MCRAQVSYNVSARLIFFPLLMRRRSRGFTLLETIVAVSVAAVLVGIIATVVSMIARNKRDLVARGEMVGTTVQTEEVLRRDIERAGHRLFSTYNVSGVNAIVTDPNTTPSDTLILLLARGRAILNSSKPCSMLGGSDCMVLVGDVTQELAAGDLVLTGNPQLGGRILQITDVRGPITLPCGTDCAGERIATTRITTGVILDSVVVSRTIIWKDGRETTEAGACPALEQNPAWDRCIEHKELRTVGESVTIGGAQTAGGLWTYTEVAFVDRTSDPFGYPTATTWTSQSGSYGIPAVYTQLIDFARYYVDSRGGDRPMLVRQGTITPNGRFGPAEPVAFGVDNLRVYTQHRGTPSFVRGVGLKQSDLMPDAGNPNYRETSSIGSGAVTRGYEFLQSYMTIASVRVQYDLLKLNNEEVVQRIPIAVQVATPQLLDGGVIDTRLTETDRLPSTIPEGSIHNQPPVARLKANPSPAEAGQSVMLADDGSYDPDGTIVLYSFDPGDGSAVRTGVTSVLHTYKNPGTYYPSLTVTDDGGLMATHTIELQVAASNLPPIASFTLPNNPVSGIWLSFTSTSSDPDGTIVRHEWTFSDGQTASGSVATVMFDAPGDYTVTLTVTDDRGATDTRSASFKVTSGNAPPTAVITPPACASTFCHAGLPYTWIGTASSDPDGSIVRYTWDFGDGSPASVGGQVEHIFINGGRYTVTLTVTDNDGATGSVSVEVDVNAAPVAVLSMPPCATSAQACEANTSYKFDGSASYDPDGSVVAYRFDTGDGRVFNTAVAEWAYDLPGTYQVTLTVVDNLGNSGSVTRSIEINPNQFNLGISCPVYARLAQGEQIAITCKVAGGHSSKVLYTFSALSGNTQIASTGAPSPLTANLARGDTIQVSFPVIAGSLDGSVAITFRALAGSTPAGQTTIAIDVVSYYLIGIERLAEGPGLHVFTVDGATSGGVVRSGTSSWSLTPGGLTALVFDKSNLRTPESITFHATNVSLDDSRNLADFLNNLPEGKYVVIASSGSWKGSIDNSLRDALARLGFGHLQSSSLGNAYNLIIDTDDLHRNIESFDRSILATVSGGNLYGSNIIAPREYGYIPLRVTNYSSKAGSVSLSATCDGRIVYCSIFDETGKAISATKELQPDSSQVILVQLLADTRDGIGSVTLVGSLGTATGSYTESVWVRERTIRPAPYLWLVDQNPTAAPGETGTIRAEILNTFSEARAFALTATAEDPSVVTLETSPSIQVGPFAQRMIDLTYRVPDNAVPGTTTEMTLSATDGLAPTATTSTYFLVADPGAGGDRQLEILAPATVGADPGTSGVLEFRLVSLSDQTRTYTISLGRDGPIASAAGPTSITVPARDTVILSVNFIVSSTAVAGERGTITVTAIDGGASYTAFTTITANVVPLAPTVEPPADRVVLPATLDSSRFDIRNNSNIERTFKLTVTKSGPISTVIAPPSITVPAYADTAVFVTWKIDDHAPAQAIAQITITVADGLLSGMASQKLTIASIEEKPVIEAPANFVASRGESGAKTFFVVNSSNVPRTFALQTTVSGIVLSANAPATVTIAPFDRQPVTVSYKIDDMAIAARTGTISLRAVAGGSEAEAVVLVTAAAEYGLQISDIHGYVFRPGSPTKLVFTIDNTGNAPVTVGFAALTTAPSGHTLVQITPPSAVSVPPFASLSVSADAVVPVGTPADMPVFGGLIGFVAGQSAVADTGTVYGSASLALANPTVIAPPSFDADPGASGSLTFTVRSNSNESRTYSIVLEKSGPITSATTSPTSVTIPAFGSSNVTVTWTLSATAVADSIGAIRLIARDGQYEGSDVVNITTNLIELAPAITGQHTDHAVGTGTVYRDTITVQNRTNQTRQLQIHAWGASQSNPLAAVYVPDDAGTSEAVYTFLPYESRDVVIRYDTDPPGDPAQTAAGAKATLYYRVVDLETPSLNAMVSHEVTVQLEEKTPSLIPPGVQEGYPGMVDTVTFQVRNETNAPRTFGFTVSSSNPSVVSSVTAPAQTTFAPYETKTVSVVYQVATLASADGSATITLTATDLTNPSLQNSSSFVFRTLVVEQSPQISGQHGNHTVKPGDVHVDTVTVTNRTNAIRNLQIWASHKNPNVVAEILNPNGSDGVATISFGPHETKSLVFRYTVSNNALANTVDTIYYHVQDQARSTLNHSVSHRVTVELTPREPIILSSPTDHVVNPGTTEQHHFYVVNMTNAPRTLVIKGQKDPASSPVVSECTGQGTLTFNAFEQKEVWVRDGVYSAATGGDQGKCWIIVEDPVSGLQASTAYTITAALIRVSPTVSDVGNRIMLPGATATLTYQVTNRSNAPENICFAITSSNISAVVDPDEPACVNINPSQTVPVTFTIRADDYAIWNDQATITFRAFVNGYANQYYSVDDFVVTIDRLTQAPAVDVEPDHTLKPNESATVSYLVTNRSNYSETLCFRVSSSNPSIVPKPADPACLTVGPHGQQTVSFDVKANPQTHAGAASDITFEAYIQNNPSYVTSDQFRVTIETVLANPTVSCPSAATLVSIGSSGSAQCRVTNNSNATRTFVVTASVDGTYIVQARFGSSSTTTITVPPFQSASLPTLTYNATSQDIEGRGSVLVRAEDQASSVFRGAFQIDVDVRSPAVPPTVTPPNVAYVFRNRSWGPYYWTVKNNSSLARQYCFTVTAGAYLNLTSTPSCVTIGAGQSATVPVSFSVQNVYGDAATSIRLEAYDSARPSVRNAADHVVRIPADPTVTPSSSSTIYVSAGGTYTITVNVRNNSAWPYYFGYTGGSGNAAIVNNPWTTGIWTTLNPYETRQLSLQFTTRSPIPSGVSTAISVCLWNASWGGALGGAAMWCAEQQISTISLPPQVSCLSSYATNPGGLDQVNACVSNPNSVPLTVNVTASIVRRSKGCSIYVSEANPITINALGTKQVGLYVSAPIIGTDYCDFRVTATDANDPTLSHSAEFRVIAYSDCDFCYTDADRDNLLLPPILLSAPSLMCETGAAVAGAPVRCHTVSEDADIVVYHRYDWGDGSDSHIVAGDRGEAVHIYAEPGEYTVLAYVVGADGTTSAHRSTRLVIGENRPPRAPTIWHDCRGDCLTEQPFWISIETDDPDAERYGDAVKAIYLDLGDGRAVWAEPGSRVPVSYDRPGSYQITAIAYDRAGAASQAGMLILPVRAPAEPMVACEIPDSAAEDHRTVISLEFASEIPIVEAKLAVGRGEPVYATLPALYSGSVAIEYLFDAAGEHHLICSVKDVRGREFAWDGKVRTRPLESSAVQ